MCAEVITIEVVWQKPQLGSRGSRGKNWLGIHKES
jgi:hypothetical protein